MYKRFRDKWAEQEKRKANPTEGCKKTTKRKKVSKPQKPIIYTVDKIDDVSLFKAVCFAIELTRNGNPFDAANSIAARYYGVDVSDVAHYVGQRAQRLKQYRNDDSVVLYDTFRDIY